MNVSSTKAESGKNRLAILTTFPHLRRAKPAANGYIELALNDYIELTLKQ
ncbi:hypothetical protein [Pseudanabaena minima]